MGELMRQKFRNRLKTQSSARVKEKAQISWKNKMFRSGCCRVQPKSRNNNSIQKEPPGCQNNELPSRL